MTQDLLPAALAHPPVHRAKAAIRFGRRGGMSASVKITSGGILSIGALVSGILLSTAVLVHTSGRARRARSED
ncbi:hypothetical protein U1701_04945 [Sphingomonas sp. PB2P19]|uniref:hypothetical protein n=1 Tax=Sphingomonas rhamnosi TaxID=3096156 RepID=UPI002FC9F7E0